MSLFSRYKNFLNATFRDAQRQYLIEALEPIMPHEPATMLDIGTANGEFAYMLQQTIPSLVFSGIEVIERGTPFIPITLYDGNTIPFDTGSFDYTILVNMLHHTADQKALMKEAARVSRKGVIIKDHYANNVLDHLTLLAMEYSNPNSGALMKMPLKFHSKKQWDAMFAELGLTCDAYADRFTSYGKYWDLLLGRGMHFIGRYSKKAI